MLLGGGSRHQTSHVWLGRFLVTPCPVGALSFFARTLSTSLQGTPFSNSVCSTQCPQVHLWSQTKRVKTSKLRKYECRCWDNHKKKFPSVKKCISHIHNIHATMYMYFPKDYCLHKYFLCMRLLHITLNNGCKNVWCMCSPCILVSWLLLAFSCFV